MERSKSCRGAGPGTIAVTGALSFALSLASLALPSTAAVAGEIRRGADYVAVVFEAEDHLSRDERWVLTGPGTPAQENDPDHNHSDGASGGEYLELLPDIRVKHGDPFGPPQGFWPQPGDGPKASYAVDFPEPGRYHVHARVFSTGTEDNGIHFGLDGQWPDSAKALQACTGGERAWRWSSRRRYVGGRSCGVEKSVWLTVEKAGAHVVAISAREDGFELDRVMLIKDLSEGTRTCSPVMDKADDIACLDGGIDVSDDRVELKIDLGFHYESEVEVMDRESGESGTAIEIELAAEPREPVAVGDTVEVGVRVTNRDVYDNATGTVIDFELAESDWRLRGSSDDCNRDGNVVSCPLGTIRPTGENEAKVVKLTLEALSEGLVPIGAVVRAEQEDNFVGNDSRSILVDVGPGAATGRVSIELAGRTAGPALAGGESFTIEATVRNTGQARTDDVVLTFGLDAGLEVDVVPAACGFDTGAQRLVCDVGAILAGESQRLAIGVSAETVGTYAVAVNASGTDSSEDSADLNIEFVAASGKGGDEDESTDAVTDGIDSGGGDGGTGSGAGTGSDDGAGYDTGDTAGDTAGDTGGGEAGGGETGGGETGGTTGITTGTATGGAGSGDGIGSGSDGLSDGEETVDTANGNADGTSDREPAGESASRKSGGGAVGVLLPIALVLIGRFRRRLAG